MRVHGFRNYGGEKHYLVNQRKGNKVYIPEWMTKLEAKEYSVVSMPCIGLEALLVLRRLLDSKLSSIRDNTSHEIRSHPECRDAQDAKRDIPVPLSPSLVTTAYCAPAALRPCRFATPSQARRWLRSTPSNGWTACRMRLHMVSAGYGTCGPFATPTIRTRLRLPAGLRAFASLSMARSGR